MTDPTNAGIIQVGEERWIPGSQRADGSFRKERKVRPGFVPLEDVQRYSNARIQASREASLPPGAKATTSSIPGATKKKPAEKKAKPAAAVKPTVAPTPPAADQTKDKKIKALNKKIRQITELEQKLIKGEKLNEEQHEKVKKGKSLREELEKLSLE